MEKQVNESQFVASGDRKSIGAGDIERWAALLADGAAAIPAHWPDNLKDRLAAEVGERRRQRFVRYLARAIARDIQSSRETATRDTANS